MLEDHKIIELFFARSEQAIRELDLKYGRLCHRLSYNILGSWQDAEECVNDAYLGAWNTIPPAKPDPLQSYLCRIVRNISLTLYHKNIAAKRNSTYETVLQEMEDCLSAPHTVESEIETRALAEMIETFLDTLSAQNCAIFLRRYWFCDTYAEIAAYAGISEKTVSVRLTRMRKQLKAYLMEREVFI